MKEISRKEKEAGIIPDPDIDTYMKVPFYCFGLFPKKLKHDHTKLMENF